ncbi:MAG: peptidase [Actinomycetota bacterium]
MALGAAATHGRNGLIGAALALALALIAVVPAVAQTQRSSAKKASPRYALAGGCYGLRSQSLGRFVAKDGAGGYSASAGNVSGAEPFRMQATDLGSYLFFGRQADFLAVGSPVVPLGPQSSVESAPGASEAADWRVDNAGPGAFRVVSLKDGKALAVASGGELTLADAASAGDSAAFSFQRTEGCPVYPEVDTNAVGKPLRRKPRYGETRGFVDAHMHMMAFEFLGGSVHCGRPWHRYGAPYALVDCADHQPNGCAAVLENVLYGNPARCHDPVGWPTFKDWPHHASLTHEQSYYKWLERAWRGGQRVFVNLFVENKVLCELYPLKRNSCDEMTSVRLQAQDIHDLEDYIDAQYGGPGKGWFRIVTNPFQARRVINSGKLAVVLGIEVSEPFGCRVYNDAPLCDRAGINNGLDEVYRLGVRDMEIINKFDNALAGVAGDYGSTGVAVNSANRYETGKYWQLQPCDGPPDESDKEQIGTYTHNDDDLVSSGLETFLPSGFAPVYPTGPQCNTRGLTSLGEHLIRRMIAKKMIVDPDHLGVLARKQVMSLIDAARYSGVVSSHSWSTPDVIPRIYKRGGFVAPYAGSSDDFVEAWRDIRPKRSRRYFFGFGYGADMNGFGAQGGPRGAPNPVRYPFKSFDGGVTLQRQTSGQRVFDINSDGVAHYGLYPDWIEDLRMIAGRRIVKDMARGSEAYLQTWERAVGVPPVRCRYAHAHFTPRGLSKAHLGYGPRRLLKRAGQPIRRSRAWRYCIRGRRNRKAKVVAVFTRRGKVGLVVSTGHTHEANGVAGGEAAGRLRGRAAALGGGLWKGGTGRGGTQFVYGVRAGRVRFVAVASRSVAGSRQRLRRYLRLAKVR